MKNMICAPDELISGIKKDKIYVFLMGPIQNAPEWQFTVPEINNVVWLNPRRPNVEGKLSSEEWEKQFNWETLGLRICDYVLCWIPSPANKESEREYARTTRSEITEVLARKKNVILGISDDFGGRRYLEEKAKQYGLSVVHHSLESCLDNLKETINNKKPKVFFTADTHFSAQRTLELSKRPFINTSDMDFALIENWNKVVGINDRVFHLGDMGNWSRLKFLNGNISLVLGNYERKEMEEKKMDYVDYHDWLINDLGLIDVKLNYDVYKFDLENFKKEVKLVHEPSKFFQEPRYKFGLCGHCHQVQVRKWGYNVGVDCNNYTPCDEERAAFYLTAIEKFYDEETWL